MWTGFCECMESVFLRSEKRESTVIIISCRLPVSGVEVSDCGRYILLYISKGAEPRNKLYYCDMEKLEGSRITGGLKMKY